MWDTGYSLGKEQTLELLVSCSDRSPACCQPGSPTLFSPDFAGGRCLTAFSGPFPILCVCSDLHPALKAPSHPKNRGGEEDLQKYIKMSSPFRAQEKWAHAPDLIVSTLSMCLESSLPCNYF